MTIFLKIAWRNIIRNRYRSLITIAAVTLGFTSLIFIRAFIDGADYQMIENYTDLVTGHIKIERIGFQELMGLERSIDNPRQIESILKNTPAVTTFSPRIKDNVLVSSTEGSAGVLLVGVDPVREPKITKLNKKIREGAYLAQADQIVIGKDLRKILKVDIGDKVVLMGQGADGSLASGAYRVCGILDTGAEEIDKTLALITLKAAQDLLVLEDKVSEFSIRTKNVNKVDALAAALRTKLNTGIYEVMTWKEISPMTVQWLEFDRAFSNIILFIVMLVVAAGILNTILMSVLERVREFGIMLALGTKRAQMVSMVLLESAILGSIGMLCGGSLGAGLAAYFNAKGIDLSGFSNALNSYYAGSVIYPRLDLGYLVWAGLIVLFTSIIVGIYPAWKIANLRPVDAVRA
jgi:putative ABC transport system permease protein